MPSMGLHLASPNKASDLMVQAVSVQMAPGVPMVLLGQEDLVGSTILCQCQALVHLVEEAPVTTLGLWEAHLAHMGLEE